MAWVIGLKSNNSIVEVTTKDRNNDFTLNELETIIPAKFGGVKSDYTFYKLSNAQTNKLEDGEEYVIVWTGNLVTDINFNVEGNKRWIKIFTDKTSVKDNGTNKANITIELWDKNLIGVDTSYNDNNFRLPIVFDNRIIFVRFAVVAGVANVKFNPTVAGEYIIPVERKRFDNVRVFNRIKIEVDSVSLFEPV